MTRGCYGGSSKLAYEFIHKYNITDETCSSYRALGHNTGLSCSSELICADCDISGCKPKIDYNIYKVGEYGSVSGENKMMEEIYLRGPISCAIHFR